MGGKKISALTESTTVPSNSYTIIVDGTVNKKIKLETITKDLSDRVNEVNTQLNTTISNLSNRIDTQDTTISNLSNRIDGGNEQLDNMESKIELRINDVNTELNNIKKSLLISYINENTFDVAEVINELLQNSTYLSFEGLQEINIKSPIIIQKPNTVLDLSGCKIIADVEMESVITTECSIGKHIYNVVIQNGEIDCDYKSNYGI